MSLFAALLMASSAAPAGPAAPVVEPVRPAGGARAVARVVVEILPAARAVAEPDQPEPRRQVRRNASGQAVVEFE